jgi:hypothetical protein
MDEMTLEQMKREIDHQVRNRSMDSANLSKAVQGCGVQVGSMPTTQGTWVPSSEDFTLHNIDDAMQYQPWTADQASDGDVVREALTAAAKAILRHVPAGRFRSVALRNIIDARMNANAAISFRGRF